MTLPEIANEVQAQWNATHGPYYQVDASVLRWNFSEQDLVKYKAVKIAGVSAIIGVASESGLKFGIPSRNLWLSLWGEVPHGKEADFVRDLESMAKVEQKAKIVIGADEFHHVPGVPLDTGARLIEALKNAGFQGAVEADFIGDAFSTSVTTYVASAVSQAKAQSYALSPLNCESDVAALHKFLSTEFPGRWTREFQFWRSRKDTKRGFWMSLNRGDEQNPVGFARMAIRGSSSFESGWTPGALRAPLSQDAATRWLATDACLGPIGVASSERGKGTGKILLGLVLNKLREEGAKRVCIDWTDALKYYEPLQFEKARQYWNAWK